MEYQNPSEDAIRSTDLAARSLIRLFNINDTTWQQEMDMVKKLIDAVKAEETTEADNEVTSVQFTLKPVGEGLEYKVVTTSNYIPEDEVALSNVISKVGGFSKKTVFGCKSCCCITHCAVADKHARNVVELAVPTLSKLPQSQFPNFGDKSWQSLDDYEEEIFSSHLVETDEFISMLTATCTDFNYKTDGEGGDSSPY